MLRYVRNVLMLSHDTTLLCVAWCGMQQRAAHCSDSVVVVSPSMMMLYETWCAWAWYRGIVLSHTPPISAWYQAK